MSEDDLYHEVSESIVVVRKKFLAICDNDMCAAMLLDRFYAQLATSIERAREHRWYLECGMDDEHYNPDRNYDHTYATIKILTDKLLNMFEPEHVTESLVFLQDKGYIDALVTDDNEDLDLIYRSLDIVCYQKNLKDAFTQYDVEPKIKILGEYPDKPGIPLDVEMSETPRPAVLAATISPEETKAKRASEEVIKVMQHNKRAQKVNLPATLTLDEWIFTLDHFEWNCAYCQKQPYKILEHFIPLGHGGGTTKTNCVPSCGSCNVQKSSWNPLAAYGPDLSHMREGLDRVKAYFDNLAQPAPIVVETNVVQQ